MLCCCLATAAYFFFCLAIGNVKIPEYRNHIAAQLLGIAYAVCVVKLVKQPNPPLGNVVSKEGIVEIVKYICHGLAKGLVKAAKVIFFFRKRLLPAFFYINLTAMLSKWHRYETCRGYADVKILGKQQLREYKHYTKTKRRYQLWHGGGRAVGKSDGGYGAFYPWHVARWQQRGH
jgi:hypothetical protein